MENEKDFKHGNSCNPTYSLINELKTAPSSKLYSPNEIP